MHARGRWQGVLLLGMSLAAEAYGAPLIDNDRVTVWDVPLPEGVSGPMTPQNEDTVMVPAIPNDTGYPSAFPRAGSVKVLDNSRVTAWHYSWTKGAPTGMHFHDKDFVVAFRYDSMQSILALDGANRINSVKAGDILFLKRGLTHSEGLTTDRQSAVYLELK
jgi:hypothetical protein